MPTTYPNQRTVRVHRERVTTDFLGIKNENWKAAARDLSPHALKLYMYLASNADNYELALSQAAIREEIGMPRSTYHDQFHILVDKGYLVPVHGNTYDFFETPQPRLDKQGISKVSSDGTDFKDNTAAGFETPQPVLKGTVERTEINNRYSINNTINSDDFQF